MSTNRGIFESFPSQPAKGQDSPFSVAKEPAEPRRDSPFTVIDDAAEASTWKNRQAGETSRTPENGVAIPSGRAIRGIRFRGSCPDGRFFKFSEPVRCEHVRSDAGGFAVLHSPVTVRRPIAVLGGIRRRRLPQFRRPPKRLSRLFRRRTGPAPEPFTPAPIPAAFAAPAAAPAFAQASTPAPAAAKSVVDESNSDSFSIRQLELRAIFGVDREMTTDEIMQRTRALPGLRNIARVRSIDMATIEGLKPRALQPRIRQWNAQALLGFRAIGVHPRR